MTVRAAALLLLLSAPLGAHDFWIRPQSFRPAPDAPLAVELQVGQPGEVEAVARDAARIERFVLIGPGGETAVGGREGGTPAGLLRVPGPGAQVLVYRGTRRSIELEALKFSAYLLEEGLENVSAERRARGESHAPGREVYSRCAKSLLRAGADAAGPFDRVVGLPLELVADAPVPADDGTRTLSVTLLLEGQPLEGALVKVFDLDRMGEKDAHPRLADARSDGQGRASFKLAAGARVIVSAVHMQAAPPEADTPEFDADWESLWASLTLELDA